MSDDFLFVLNFNTEQLQLTRFKNDDFSYPISKDTMDLSIIDGDVQMLFFGKLFSPSVSKEKRNELLLNLYKSKGIDFLRDLNGQFGVLIIDKNCKSIFLCRDQIGIESLYYYAKSNLIVASTKLKLLLSHPNIQTEYSVEKALNYFNDPIFFDYETYFSNIFLLPEGSYMKIDYEKKRHNLYRFFEITDNIDDKIDDIEKIKKNFWEVLYDSIEIRNPKNIPIFILLSGGVDSSLLAKVTSNFNPVICLSMINYLTFKSGDSKNAFKVSEDINGKLIYFINSYRTSNITLKDWKKLIFLSETPNVNLRTLYRYYINSFISSEYSFDQKFLFTGLGSDQFYGGTSRTTLMHMKYPSSKLSWNSYFQRIENFQYNNISYPHRVKDVYKEFLTSQYIKQTSYCKNLDAWHFKLKMELFYFNFLDVHPEEKISNYYGNQAVFPFLDYRLVTLASQIPPKYYDDLLFDKKLIRLISKGRVPFDTEKIKSGFFISKEESRANKMFFELITDKQGNLLEEFKDLISESKTFDLHKIDSVMALAHSNSDFTIIPKIMNILNCLLFNNTLFEGVTQFQDTNHSEYNPPILTIKDWEKESLKLLEALKVEDPPSEETKFSLLSRIKFADDVLFLKDNANDKYYLSKNYSIIFAIDSENLAWVEFLKKLNGKEWIFNELISECNIKLEDIQKFLKISHENSIIVKV